MDPSRPTVLCRHVAAARGSSEPLDGPAPGKAGTYGGFAVLNSAVAAGLLANMALNGQAKSMLVGAHSIIYSTNPDADRAFLRDVLTLPNVDVGEGWLIFGLPPAEVAVHPSDKNDLHEFYLMCDDVVAFVAEMKTRNIACGPVQNQGWGLLTHLTLPGGGKLGIYQPQHARPKAMRVSKAVRKPARPTTMKRTKEPYRKKSKKRARRAAR